MTETRYTDTQWMVDELAAVEAMAKELEAYIVDDEVYRTIMISSAGSNRRITMSGGALLARLNRLRQDPQVLSSEQQGRVTQVASNIESTIYSLRTRFHDLLRRELKARSDQNAWNTDIRRAREEEKADAAEVQNRQIIAAIRETLNTP